MKIGCFIPIKKYSERVRGKNFREIGGVPIYKAIIDKCIRAEVFSNVIVDTDSDEIAIYAKEVGAEHFARRADLAKNTANGNDLLVNQFIERPEYDYYFQVFATAPLMRVETIKKAVSVLLDSAEHDSIMTTIDHKGFFWRAGMPVSYRPDLLPRSQDLISINEETTGLYGISHDALDRLRCRIGAKPIFLPVSKLEAIDLNTDDDFAYADWLVGTGRASIVD